MEIRKSSRHTKITGDFGEAVVLYWLSKYGFECVHVDHTGIDIIARNPHTDELMGISVKSRSRSRGAEEEITVFNKNIDMAEEACKTFRCIPYFAFVVDVENTIMAFLVSMRHLLKMFPKGKTTSGWKMRKKDLEAYEQDPEVKCFAFVSKTIRWWSKRPTIPNG